MLNFCKQSCNICDFSGDLTELIVLKKRLDEVGGDETLLETPYGMKQLEAFGHEEEIVGIIATTAEYMERVIFTDERYADMKHKCKDRNHQCAFWKLVGECEKVC
jgi:hypothetical protein